MMHDLVTNSLGYLKQVEGKCLYLVATAMESLVILKKEARWSIYLVMQLDNLDLTDVMN